VADAGQPVAVTLRNTGPAKKLALVATCRGRIIDQQFVDVPAGVAAQGGTVTPASINATLKLVSGAAGLIRITAYEPRDGQLIPLSERLIYRVPARGLALGLTPQNAEYRSGSRADLKLHTLNERGEKSPAWLLGLVVDERVAPRQPSLPAYFYLLSDLRSEIDNADILLNEAPDYFADLVPGTGPLVRGLENARRSQARQLLDLYLGTSGWRHFGRSEEPAMLAKADAQGAIGGQGGKANTADKADKGGGAKRTAATAETVALLSSENAPPALVEAQYKTALEQ